MKINLFKGLERIAQMEEGVETSTQKRVFIVETVETVKSTNVETSTFVEQELNAPVSSEELEILKDELKMTRWGKNPATSVADFMNGDITGAERLVRTYVRANEKYGDILFLQKSDIEDLQQQIWLTIFEYAGERTQEIAEPFASHWGITSWEEWRKGRNKFMSLVRATRKVNRHGVIDQDFGQESKKDPFEEVELDLFLKALLGAETASVMELTCGNGFKDKEAAKLLEMSLRTLQRVKAQGREKMAAAYAINIKGEKEALEKAKQEKKKRREEKKLLKEKEREEKEKNKE